MKDPVGRCFVLPPARLEQVAHDRRRAGMPHALRRRSRRCETDDVMTSRGKDLDQLGADEPVSSGDERARHLVA
jgi:hypothetical protein